MDEPHRVIELVEYRSCRLPPEALTDEVVAALLQEYDTYVALDYPTPRTEGQWEITAKDRVGILPLSDALTLAIKPKVPLSSVFAMLEYAYAHEIKFLEGLHGFEALEDTFERLALMLSRRVLRRMQHGLYRAYVPRDERLSYIRGRVALAPMLRRPWEVQPLCHFEEHTADIEDNRILAWTLHLLSRVRFPREDARRTIRQAYRNLRSAVTMSHVEARSCVGRTYNRLNEDYRTLHGLCRFFLEHLGPGLQQGARDMIPFVIQMPSLFERFVAAWMQEHLSAAYDLTVQERIPLGPNHFDIDMVLYELHGAQATARMVLDTKYKASSSPLASDIAQVVAYAVAKDCREAVLIYPEQLASHIDVHVGEIHVRSLTFDLGKEVEVAGKAFREQLGVVNEPREAYPPIAAKAALT